MNLDQSISTELYGTLSSQFHHSQSKWNGVWLIDRNRQSIIIGWWIQMGNIFALDKHNSIYLFIDRCVLYRKISIRKYCIVNSKHLGWLIKSTMATNICTIVIAIAIAVIDKWVSVCCMWHSIVLFQLGYCLFVAIHLVFFPFVWKFITVLWGFTTHQGKY